MYSGVLHLAQKRHFLRNFEILEIVSVYSKSNRLWIYLFVLWMLITGIETLCNQNRGEEWVLGVSCKINPWIKWEQGGVDYSQMQLYLLVQVLAATRCRSWSYRTSLASQLKPWKWFPTGSSITTTKDNSPDSGLWGFRHFYWKVRPLNSSSVYIWWWKCRQSSSFFEHVNSYGSPAGTSSSRLWWS